MLQKTEGIVLKSIKYSESSVITKIFTREFGAYSFIIPGVRSSRNKSKSNIFQPLQILELDLYYHPNKSILKLKEYRIGYIYSQLYNDFARQSIAIFAIDVISKCIHEHEINAELYDFLRSFLMNLDENPEQILLLPSTFLLKISKILGFQPQVESSFEDQPYFNMESGVFESKANFQQIILDKKEACLLYHFLRNEAHLFTKKERSKILEILVAYFKIHVPTFHQIASIEILKQVLN